MKKVNLCLNLSLLVLNFYDPPKECFFLIQKYSSKKQSKWVTWEVLPYPMPK